MPSADERLRHHELCFGCGQANIFGLQLELQPREGGGVAGRFFVKQDHQGPLGYAHGGVIATALDEAMALLLHGRGMRTMTARLEVDLLAVAPVGEFVEVDAVLASEDERTLELTASARAAGSEVARARGVFVRVDG